MSQSKKPIEKQPPSGAVEAEQRHHRIAAAAYRRAAARGFAGGDPMLDWLEAEKEIDELGDFKDAPRR